MNLRPLALLSLAGVLLLPGCASHPSSSRSPPRGAVESPQPDPWASAQAAEARGDFDTALSEYVRELDAHPRNAAAHLRVGRIQARLGHPETAMQAYAKALQINPGSLDAAQELGLLEISAGRRAGARVRLEGVVKMDVARWRALNGLGVIADLEHRHNAAQVYFRRALQIRPASASLFNNLGYSQYLAGQLDDAEASFRKAALLDPDDTTSWSNLGLVYVRRGQLSRGLEALGRNQDPADARYTAGYILMLDGRLPEAESMLRSAIAMSPSYHRDAQQALAWVVEARHGATN